jgi:hypothetical protein
MEPLSLRQLYDNVLHRLDKLARDERLISRAPKDAIFIDDMLLSRYQGRHLRIHGSL